MPRRPMVTDGKPRPPYLTPGKVKVVSKKQRRADGTEYVQAPQWVGSCNVVYTNSDGTKKHITRSQVFSRIPCEQTKTGAYTGVRQAQAAFKSWHDALEAHVVKEWEDAQDPESGDRARMLALTIPQLFIEYIGRKLEGDEIEKSSEHTFRSYGKHFEWFGNATVEDLTPERLDSWKRYLLKAKGGSRLAPSTRASLWVMLKAACQMLVDLDYLRKNPLDKVKPPRRGKTEPAPKPKPLDRDSIERLNEWLDAQGYDGDRTAIELSLRCGMRRGECCGLRWKDVDFEQGFIKVVHAIANGGTTHYVKTPKNGSERYFRMSPKVRELLENRKAEAMDECDLFGVEFTDDLYVTGLPDGSYVAPAHVSAVWRTLASKEPGIIDVNGNRATFHSLRHTWISYARAFGVSDSMVKEVVGHHSTNVTDGYTGRVDEAQDKALELVDEILSTGGKK